MRQGGSVRRSDYLRHVVLSPLRLYQSGNPLPLEITMAKATLAGLTPTLQSHTEGQTNPGFNLPHAVPSPDSATTTATKADPSTPPYEPRDHATRPTKPPQAARGDAARAARGATFNRCQETPCHTSGLSVSAHKAPSSLGGLSGSAQAWSSCSWVRPFTPVRIALVRSALVKSAPSRIAPVRCCLHEARAGEIRFDQPGSEEDRPYEIRPTEIRPLELRQGRSPTS